MADVLTACHISIAESRATHTSSSRRARLCGKTGEVIMGYTLRTIAAAAVAAVLFYAGNSNAGVALNVLTNPGFESPNASAGDVYASTGWNGFNDVYTHA